MMYKYSVEMYIDGKWETHIRYYKGEVDITRWDLCDHKTRRNAKCLGIDNITNSAPI